MFGTTKLENESEIGRVRMAEIGSTRSIVKDLFGEEGIRLGGDELLESGRRPKWRSSSFSLVFVSLVLIGWGLLLMGLPRVKERGSFWQVDERSSQCSHSF